MIILQLHHNIHFYNKPRYEAAQSILRVDLTGAEWFFFRMTSEGNLFRDRSERWEALECILGRSGPLQRIEFEPSTEV